MNSEIVISKSEQDSLLINEHEVIIKPDASDGCIRRGTLADLKKITVLPEIIGILPPDSTSYNILKELLSLDGAAHSMIITAIIDGVEVVIDGHRKMQVLLELNDTNIIFYIKRINHIHTLEEAIWWIIKNCQSFRRLRSVPRVKLALRAEPAYKKLAAENKKRCGKKKNLSDSDKFLDPVDCLGLMARDAQVGRQLVDDIRFIINSDETKAEEKKELDEQKRGASTIRKEIESRIKEKEKNDISPSVPYVNHPSKYINEIIHGNCLQVLKDMFYEGIKDVALLVTSINYNVKMNYGPNFSDDLQRAEYLENIAQAIYHTQLLGRNGMKICINCTDTNNRNETDNNNFQFDIGKDLCNKVDELNAKYDDCNLRFVGRFIWYKKHSNANPCLGSKAAPVIKNDSEYILIWAKNQRKLENISGLNCKPGSGGIFSDAERDKYIITEEERMAWSYQTWCIPPCNDKKLLDVHPCPYPEDIPYRLIKMLSFPNDIVIDPYAGLCTTCKVAADLKRRYVGIEQHSTYCDFGKKRIQEPLEENNV